MDTKLIEEMFRQEKTHWWHVAKRRLVEEAIKNDWFKKKNFSIFDAGCGTGALLLELRDLTTEIYGGDISSKSLRFTKNRGISNLLKIDFEKKLPYPSKKFDCVTCLDVLEHVGNDKQMLSEFYRLLKKNGRLYLTVPAYQFLWSYWDVSLGHKRRYQKSSLIRLIGKTGFQVKYSSYFYSFLLPVAIVFRIVKTVSSQKSSDFVVFPTIINQLMLFLCWLERKLMKLFPIPFGLSIFIVAIKK